MKVVLQLLVLVALYRGTVLGQTTTPCLSNDDCLANNEYCSKGNCREFGTCGDLLDCRNPSNTFPMIECVGFMFCSDESGQCGIECAGGFCPPDEEEYDCFDLPNPCEVNTCEEDYVSCVQSSCGGCHAHFFDAAGNEVCTTTDDNDTTDLVGACSSNDNCQENEYCSQGVCREFATCGDLSDCLNPANTYTTIFCVGYTYCSADGRCGLECSDSSCPPDGGQQEVQCFVNPCDVDTCDENYVSCASTYCGGCHSHFFDAAGNQVCNDDSDTISTDRVTTCLSTDDCLATGEYYCAQGTCRESGTCSDLSDCRNPDNLYPMIECVGFLFCSPDSEQCGIECTGGFCPPGEEEVDCSQSDPCQDNFCGEPYVSCVSSNCGGCYSHFYDAAGKEVCTDDNDQQQQQVVAGACSSKEDCQENEYCSQGLCREFATCGDLSDCLNPANTYTTIFCVGFTYCSEDGRCGLECSDTSCPPDGEQEVQCFANPCDVDSCDEDYVSCASSFCGGCHSHFFDAAGKQVCTTITDDDDDQDVARTGCSNADDCQEMEYCSGGVCREFGTCGTLSDCRNPKNSYGVIDCIGVLYCSDDDGQCGLDCGPSSCPPGEDEVQCFANPCDVNTCNEDYVSCVSSYCGGCHSHFFDEAGNEVCTTDDEGADTDNQGLLASCESMDDCQENQFCSAGSCREYGACTKLSDCRNPANTYDMIECEGTLSCSEKGQCSIECGDMCPPGEEVVQCLVNPCDVDTCDEDYVSCTSSYCSGCNSHFFDKAGNEVCAGTSVEELGMMIGDTIQVNDEEVSADDNNNNDINGGDDINGTEQQAPSCSSADDCEETEYCSQGFCREFGTCSELMDCRNPSNTFPMIECVGFMYCSEEGECGIQCAGGFCPPDEEEFECFDSNPCEVDTCDEPHVSCARSSCGGCNSHFFDAAGNEVCTDDTPAAAASSSCSFTQDCQENEYCSEGVCREAGACRQLIDCYNPFNTFPMIECEGFRLCSEDGQCGIQCGSSCPPDVEEFECPDDPCDVDSCDEPYESCVSSRCGGCNSHFFNSAGMEVCVDDQEPSSQDGSSAGNGTYQRSNYLYVMTALIVLMAFGEILFL